MHYEPDTLWGRTVEGDQEIAKARSGLSLVQRRMLADLAQPRTFAALVTRYHAADAPKLERELIKLADQRLVAFQRPGAPQPRTAPRIDWPQSIPTTPAAEAWKPGPMAYAVAIGLGFTAVMLVLL